MNDRNIGGRPEKREEEKRKPKQFRISDNELHEIGNPKATEIRERLFELHNIKKLCETLDEHGIKIIPDDWLWDFMLHETNYERIQALVNSKRSLDDLIKNKNGGN